MAHPALDKMLRNQAAALAACRSDTAVQYEPDPKHPGRTAIHITGPTREAVQFQIDKVVNFIDRNGGFANFIGPWRAEFGFQARGETIVEHEKLPNASRLRVVKDDADAESFS